MERILIVEDSKVIAKAIQIEIINKLNFFCDTANTLKEAKEKIETPSNEYFMAILDLNLPDTREGEIVDFFIKSEIPSIVFTAVFDTKVRDKIVKENIVDYVLKENPQSIEYLINTITRLYKNRLIKVLVVDDSVSSRKHLIHMLKNQQFNVFEACNGREALDKLAEHPDIKLVITDYDMPIIDGFELISKIREKHTRNQMAIVGISGYKSGLLSAKLLKKGANDFVVKPFLEEEFKCRINQNVELLEYIDEIKKASNRDYLTGLYNRRYLYNYGEKLLENAKRSHFTIVTAMIDIDHFKKINDTYGHAAGDLVLKYIGKLLLDNLRTSDILVRFGGEEFCILATNMNQRGAETLFEKLRQQVEESKIPTINESISTTISIGVNMQIESTLDAIINRADDLLYKAKQSGRNCVIIE